MQGHPGFSTFFRRRTKEKARMPRHPGPFTNALVARGTAAPGKDQKFQWIDTEYVRPNLYSSARSEAAPVFL